MRGLTVGVAAVVLVAFAVLVWRGAAWLDGPGLRGLAPNQLETAVDAVRGRLLQLGAGVLAAGALVYTGLTFRLSREGHVTDRYTKAIEQLGSERVDVRLGAIYALERIMIDSARDHPAIVEVLAAFVREHSSLDATDLGDKQPGADDDMRRPHDVVGPATDVQAALTVLGRRPPGREERGRLDLRSTNLSGADLVRADLSNADLTKADLTRADLGDANMAGAVLMWTILNSAMPTWSARSWSMRI